MKINQEKNEKALKLTLKRVGNSDEWTQNVKPTVDTPPTTPSLVPPPAKKRRRNLPKDAAPHNRPLTPASKSPSVERSPYNGIGFHVSSPTFPLDGILTPTSISPCEEIQIEPMDQIVSMIVNWDADKLIDQRYKSMAFHKNLAAAPQSSFETFEYYQKCVFHSD